MLVSKVIIVGTQKGSKTIDKPSSCLYNFRAIIIIVLEKIKISLQFNL